MTPPLSILVAGAGIGGLAAAVALRMAGHSVRILDSFDSPRPVGSGLVVQPVGQRVLDWLGAGAAVRATGQPIRVLRGIEARTGITALSVRYDTGAPGQHGLGLHRASLFTALHDRLTALGLIVETGCLVQTSDVADHGRWVQLADGRRLGPFDLVVDALGSHSPLSPLVSRPLPYGALWTTLRWPDGTDLPDDHLSQRYLAARRMVGILPVGTLPDSTTRLNAFFWSIRADALPGWQAAPLEAWKTEVLDLWPALRPWMDQITDKDQLTFAQYTHGTLSKPYADRLVHIGDCAHRTSPQLGQGANMALLDALALTRALDQATLADALPLYRRIRWGHLRVYQALSRFLTPQYQHDSALLAVARDRVFAPMARVWPFPRVLGSIASGLIVPPLAGEAHLGRRPQPPAWAVDATPREW